MLAAVRAHAARIARAAGYAGVLVGAGDPLGTGRRGGSTTGTGTSTRRRRALRREAVADAEVRVDVAPVRRHPLELLAQLAHEHVDRAVAVDHRVAPHALVDLLARQDLPLVVGEQLDQLELAAREVGAAAGREGLELVEPDLELAGHDRAPRRRAPRRARRRRTTASARAMTSSGWHGLVTQSSAPSRSPRTRWATVDWPGADHDAELREPGAQLLQVRPRRGAEDRRGRRRWR